MKRITVELMNDPRDGSTFYVATERERGRRAESDHVRSLRDVHAQVALATQAVARLGERIEADS